MTLLQMVLNFFYISIFGFGGGYAIAPMLQERLVEVKHWMTPLEFINMIAISQATPGPLVVNSATFTGVRMAGVLGGVIATISVTILSACIALFLAYLYKKHKEMLFVRTLMKILRPATVAFIMVAAVDVIRLVVLPENVVNALGIALIVASFIAIRKFKMNYIAAMLACGFLSIVWGIVV